MRARDLATEYVKCRALGHEWDTFQPISRKAARGYLVSLRCARCGMERHDTIDSLGNLSTRSYVQPEGYAFAADELPSRPELICLSRCAEFRFQLRCSPIAGRIPCERTPGR